MFISRSFFIICLMSVDNSELWVSKLAMLIISALAPHNYLICTLHFSLQLDCKRDGCFVIGFLLLLDLLASLDLFFKKTAKKISWIIYRNHYEIVMATFWAIFLIWLKLIFDLSRYILGDFLWNLGDISLFSSGNTAWVRSGAFQKALRRRKVGAFSFIFLFVRLEEFAHLLEHNVRSKNKEIFWRFFFPHPFFTDYDLNNAFTWGK